MHHYTKEHIFLYICSLRSKNLPFLYRSEHSRYFEIHLRLKATLEGLKAWHNLGMLCLFLQTKLNSSDCLDLTQSCMYSSLYRNQLSSHAIAAASWICPECLFFEGTPGHGACPVIVFTSPMHPRLHCAYQLRFAAVAMIPLIWEWGLGCYISSMPPSVAYPADPKPTVQKMRHSTPLA